MNVLAIHFNYLPKFSGAAIQYHALAREMIGLGHQVIVLAARHPGLEGEQIIDDVRIIRAPIRGMNRYIKLLFFALTASFRLIQYRKEYQIIHLINYGVFDIFMAITARLLGKKVLYQKTIMSLPPRNIKSKTYEWISTQGMLLLNGYAGLSSPLLVQAKTGSLSKKPKRVLSRGVDLEIFHPINKADKITLRQKLELETEANYICFVGSIVERKGVDILIEAFQQVRSTCQENLRLLLIGKDEFSSGDFTNSLEDEAQRFVGRLKKSVLDEGLENVVIFTGFTERVAEYMQASDMFVFPSRREGLGAVVLQAMACGLPCIISEMDGIAYDMIQDGIDGVVVPELTPKSFAEAIIHLLRYRNIAEHLGENARQTVEQKFSIHATAITYLEFYQELLNQ